MLTEPTITDKHMRNVPKTIEEMLAYSDKPIVDQVRELKAGRPIWIKGEHIGGDFKRRREELRMIIGSFSMHAEIDGGVMLVLPQAYPRSFARAIMRSVGWFARVGVSPEVVSKTVAEVVKGLPDQQCVCFTDVYKHPSVQALRVDHGAISRAITDMGYARRQKRIQKGGYPVQRYWKVPYNTAGYVCACGAKQGELHADDCPKK